jgi:hypothetical protein
MQALETLRRQGLVYACSCSRAEIVAATGGPSGPKASARQPDVRSDSDPDVRTVPHPDVRTAGRPRDAGAKVGFRGGPSGAGDEIELRYPGTCRDRGLVDGRGLGLRVRLASSVERFVDLRLGPQQQDPSAQCGDLLVRDREGNWTYQFAAAVDDFVGRHAGRPRRRPARLDQPADPDRATARRGTRRCSCTTG